MYIRTDEMLGQQADPARPDLGVSAKQVTDYDSAFRKEAGEKFKALVEWAAKKVNMNPGLLAVNLIAEKQRRFYLSKDPIDSYEVGTDDFFVKRHDMSKRVPAFADVGWDKKSEPTIDINERSDGREVKTIMFNSGRDALLGSAVYLKHGEEVLREAASKAGGNFDDLPVETRFALIRRAFIAGHGAARGVLKQALEGQDVLIRKVRQKALQELRQKRGLTKKQRKELRKFIIGQRKATIHAARAIHLSQEVFGVPAR